ncbi:hypothetical protein E5D57_011961 [Metarhizium anisopliae]|nr:hypothetical protein E5D57_011961 [Metarhizium anisopliae]
MLEIQQGQRELPDKLMIPYSPRLAPLLMPPVANTRKASLPRGIEPRRSSSRYPRPTTQSNFVILQAVNLFINTFPELAILHLPTFIAELHAEREPESKVLLGAVLAVTKAQLSVQSASWADELLSREHYALYAKDVLSDFILQPPKVQIVQALLIITLHEWGTRDFHKAWVYCGE